MNKPLVIVESPFASSSTVTQEQHVTYAQSCVLHSVKQNECPFASHLFYTQIFDDDLLSDRKLGIDLGLTWYKKADISAVYVDHGISAGMVQGITEAYKQGVTIDWRSIFYPEVLAKNRTFSLRTTGFLLSLTYGLSTETKYQFANLINRVI